MKGIPASEGIAVGPVFIWSSEEPTIDKRAINIAAEEVSKFSEAVLLSKDQIKLIQEKALKSMGEEEAQVFDAHLLLLEDPEWIGKIENQIEKDLICSEYITKSVTNEFVAIFEAMDNEYLKARAADLNDVSMRLIKNIMGLPTGLTDLGEDPVIIVAKDLTPSDTAQLDKNAVIGFITELGNKTSHSAIIARTMGIPALVGAKGLLEEIRGISVEQDKSQEKGSIVIAFDGATGELHINPDNQILEQLKEEQFKLDQENELNETVRGKESTSLDGRIVEIACNIAQPGEADLVVEHDGEGVGLFRSEFLFMDRSEAPSENDQFYAYKTAAEKLNGRPLIIRTLDAGGDKHIPYLNVEEEMNPFLGYRAIRICLDNEVLFRTQIRAILKASAFGKIKMMFPMIATVDEFIRSKEIVMSEMDNLRNENVLYDEQMELGIMVEIPSTAVMADAFAQHVDFFSIGTNDLTQYTLAADRMNQKLEYLYNHRNPAVLRLIKMVIDAAHRKNKWVGMCGEAAGDKIMIPILLGLGLDEFSMAPSSVLPARRLIRSLKYEEVQQLAEDVLKMSDVGLIEETVSKFTANL